MKRHRPTGLFLATALLLVAVGCANPIVRSRRHYDRGMNFFQHEQYSEAAIEFANAVQIDKEFADGHYQLAQCYLKQGAYAAAFNQLLRVLEIRPGMWKAQIDVGNLFLGTQQFDKAKERADMVLENQPNDVGAHLLLANAQAGLNHPDLSLAEMDKAIALEPERASSWLNLGMLQERFAPEKAEASLVKGVNLSPKSRDGVMLLGDYYARNKRWADAEAQYRRAVDLLPNDQEPRAALARLYLQQNDAARAEAVLLEAQQAAPNDPHAYRMLGDYLVQTDQFNRAVFQFAYLHRLHPDDLKVTKNYISLLLPFNRLVEATRLTNEVLGKNEKDVEAKALRADIWIRSGKANEAIDLLGKLLKVDPDNGFAHYLLGKALAQVGDASRAEDEWKEALRLRPDLNDARRAMATVALRKGQSELLSDMIDQLIQAEPSNPRWYAYRAASELARDHRAEAEADYRKAIAVAPSDPIGYCGVGNLFFTSGKLADAEKFYEQTLDRDPNYVDAMQGLMAVAMQQKQEDKALARVDEQIRRAPRNSAYYTLRGTLLLAKGDTDGAIDAFTRSTQLNKNDVDAFALLGQAYSMKGSVPQAIAAYQRSVENNPNDARSYVLLGSLEYGQKNYKRAHDMYEKALGVEHDYPLAANNLAYIMLERDENLDVAASLAQVARRGMPEEPTSADTLGWAYYKKGAYSLAIDLFQDALRTSPNNATYHYHLAMALQQIHRWDQARQEFQKALELNPDDPRAEEIKKNLQGLGTS